MSGQKLSRRRGSTSGQDLPRVPRTVDSGDVALTAETRYQSTVESERRIRRVGPSSCGAESGPGDEHRVCLATTQHSRVVENRQQKPTTAAAEFMGSVRIAVPRQPSRPLSRSTFSSLHTGTHLSALVNRGRSLVWRPHAQRHEHNLRSRVIYTRPDLWFIPPLGCGDTVAAGRLRRAVPSPIQGITVTGTGRQAAFHPV